MMAYIHELAQTDTALNNNMLMSRYGRLAHYDHFVKGVERSKRLHGLLQQDSSTLYRKGRKEIDELTDKALQLSSRKEYLLELFKSKNAILQNSLRYFPTQVAITVGDEAKDLDKLDGEMKNDLTDLAVDVLDYTVTGNEGAQAHVILHSEAVSKRLDQVDKAVRDNVKLVLVHADVILQQKPAVDALVSELLKLPSPQNYQALTAAYDADYGARIEESNRYRIGLYVLPLLLLGYIAYVLIKLQRNAITLRWAVADLKQQKRALDESYEKLATFNHELESRVQDRTADLESNQKQLEYYLTDLTRKNEENDMFVYSVSHDLRSPLVNLQGFSRELEMVAQDLRAVLVEGNCTLEVQKRGMALIDEDMSSSLHFIQAGVVRLSNIMDGLLQLSRVGRVEYQMQHVDLNSIVKRIIDSMQTIISQRCATVTVQELPAAWVDSGAVEQIFANLIGNALNYLDPKRLGLIEVGCCADKEVTHNAVFNSYYVKDNGLGISEQAKTKLFRIFQRFHPGSAKGEGIGLAIVRRMVERHGGRITVESTEGAGTTFFVALPSQEIKQSPIFSDTPTAEDVLFS
ncbi:MAG: ATP-binding protein [Gammaproteobacteria bacterium]|nr:ATP-binding protein [Gammaproteobacteria bacterium]